MPKIVVADDDSNMGGTGLLNLCWINREKKGMMEAVFLKLRPMGVCSYGEAD